MTSVDPPWWLAQEAHCEACSERYAVGWERWCAVCDRPVCALCVVIVDRTVLCPTCLGEEE